MTVLAGYTVLRMTDITHTSHLQRTIIHLLNHYSFDSEQRPMSFVVAGLIGYYPLNWILEAIVEALYQGRYKTISVEQILIIWQRRGRPLHHFNGEFERIVCGQLLDAASDAPMTASQDSLSTDSRNATLLNGSVNVQTNVEMNVEMNVEVKDTPQDMDYIVDACMGQDGRLSELLMEEPDLKPIHATASSALNVPAHGALAQSRASGSPLGARQGRFSEAPLGLQRLAGVTVHHYPIHQFTPVKASPTFYKKLRAIAHSYQ